MKIPKIFILLFLLINGNVWGVIIDNVTLMYPPTARQLYDYKLCNSKPDILTTSSGKPVEIRETNTLNTDFLNNEYFMDMSMHLHSERVPERVVHAKGSGAFGYFEVTNDVSMYTKADVFNGVGKVTPLAARFSSSIQNQGGNEVARELKGFSLKFYTKEGILDLLSLNIPVYFYKDPVIFSPFAHAFKRNPATNLLDPTSVWDFVSLQPIILYAWLWILSDYGNPNGYRRMNAFPIHTFELNNEKGERYYARFSLISEQGFQNLTTEQSNAITDMDYFTRDLYDNIGAGNYPAWRLQRDVMTLKEVQSVDYDPFDVTRLWKNGTYRTVPVGRVVLNRNPDNFFRNVELSAYNPGNIVPGIDGVEMLFRSRRLFYRDTQNYRLGLNHHNIDVNTPDYARTYNRDGVPPVKHNMKDSPNYTPNSFNGPMPYVDKSQPKERLLILESNAVDLDPISELYNIVLANDAERQRLVDNIVLQLAAVTSPVAERTVGLLTWADQDLGKRVLAGLEAARARVAGPTNNLGVEVQCVPPLKN